MKRVLSGMLTAVVLMGVLCMPSFAAQYKVQDVFHKKPLKNMLNFTAETVEQIDPIDVGYLIISHNYSAPVPAFRTTGVTQVFFGNAADMNYLVGYAPTLAALRNSDYTVVSAMSESWYTATYILDKPGYYVVYYGMWDYPAKGTCILEVKAGKAGAPVSFLKSFSDVDKDRWSYPSIMDMVGWNIFAGVGARDNNGVGRFDPEGKITQAQFITVLTKLLYEDEVTGMKPGEQWYSNFYTVARSKGLLPEGKFSEKDAEQPITREQMAMLAVRTAKLDGWKNTNYMVDPKRIADFDSVGEEYRDSVRTAFHMNLLSGYDDKGTFKPQGTLTREEGAAVMHKLVFKSAI